MTKNEFLSRLSGELSGLSDEDIRGSVDYYGEIIDDIIESGASEEDAVAALGSVEEVAANILTQTTIDSDEDKQRKKDHNVSMTEDNIIRTLPSKTQYNENTCPEEENFENIFIDVSEADVRLVLSDNGKLKVDCPDFDDSTGYNVSVENSTLTIKQTNGRKWYEHFGRKWSAHISINLRSTEITVFLPERIYNRLYVSARIGYISIGENLSFVSAEIHSSCGDVVFSAGVTDELTAKTVYGDLAVTGIAPNKLTVSSTCGDIKLSSVKVVGDVSAWTANGDVKLTAVTCKDLTCGGTAGDTKLRDVIADNSIICTNVSGDIQLKKCDAKSLKLTTKFGDVRGTLRSGKNFVTSTVYGEVSVPSAKTGSPCIVTTVAGDISLSLEQ